MPVGLGLGTDRIKGQIGPASPLATTAGRGEGPNVAPTTPATLPAISPPSVDTTADTPAVPQFKDDPIAALGVILSEVGAGLTGTESPIAQLKAQKLKEQEFQLQKLNFTVNAVDKGVSLASKLPDEESRNQLFDQLDQQFGKVVPGFGNILRAAAKMPDLDKVLLRAGRFGKEVSDMCGNDIQCVLEVTRDDKLMGRIEKQHDLLNEPVIRNKFDTMKKELIKAKPELSNMINNSFLTLGDLGRLNDAAGGIFSADEMATLQNNTDLQLQLGIVPPDVQKTLLEKDLGPQDTFTQETQNPDGSSSIGLYDKHSGNLIRVIGKGKDTAGSTPPLAKLQELRRTKQIDIEEARQAGNAAEVSRLQTEINEIDGAIRKETTTTAATPPNIVKLQNQRDTYNEMKKQTEDPEVQKLLDQKIGEIDAAINKETQVTGRTPEDLAAASAARVTGKTEAELAQPIPSNVARILDLPTNTTGKEAQDIGINIPHRTVLEKIASQEAEVKSFNRSAADVVTSIAGHGELLGLTGAGVRFVNEINANVESLAKLTGINIKASKDVAAYEETLDGLRGTAAASAEVRSLVVGLAFAAAAASGQSGRDVSNRDVERFITQIGDSADPQVFTQVLLNLVTEINRKYSDNVEANLGVKPKRDMLERQVQDILDSNPTNDTLTEDDLNFLQTFDKNFLDRPRFQ